MNNEPYTYKSPQPRLNNKSPNGKNLLSPKDFDNKSNKSHHSRISARSATSNATFKSYETIYSRQMLSKHEPCNAVGYNDKEINDSIDFIFDKYDDNHNDLLDRNEVLVLVRDALRHIGSKHEPT